MRFLLTVLGLHFCFNQWCNVNCLFNFSKFQVAITTYVLLVSCSRLGLYTVDLPSTWNSGLYLVCATAQLGVVSVSVSVSAKPLSCYFLRGVCTSGGQSGKVAPNKGCSWSTSGEKADSWRTITTSKLSSLSSAKTAFFHSKFQTCVSNPRNLLETFSLL